MFIKVFKKIVNHILLETEKLYLGYLVVDFYLLCLVNKRLFRNYFWNHKIRY